MSIFWLKEVPSKTQMVGLVISLAGIILYFYPQRIPIHENGFAVLLLGFFGFALQAIIGRYLARGKTIHTITQTAIPLVIGGGLLLILSIIVEGLPVIPTENYWIIAWLTLLNSMVGYLLYNRAISELTAIQVNIFLNLSPFFTAIFAWVLLGEYLNFRQIAAMTVVFSGTYLVQRENKAA